MPPTSDSIVPGAETIDLRIADAPGRVSGARRGVLLLHGFGDTPHTLRYLARALHAHGYDVRVPLLPGHGRTLAAFDASGCDEWLGAARAELTAVRARCGWVALGGLSMGGALAALLAAEVRDLPALVLLAPYLAMPPVMRWVAATHRLWSGRVGAIRSSAPDSIRDPVERAATVGYGAVTGRAVYNLGVVARRARAALPRITTPTLVIQSEEDNRIPPRVARAAHARLGATRKRLLLTRGAGHVITVDYGRERVFEEVRAWLGGGPGTDTPEPDAPIRR